MSLSHLFKRALLHPKIVHLQWLQTFAIQRLANPVLTGSAVPSRHNCYEIEDTLSDFLDEHELRRNSDHVKNLLYDDVNDEVIQSLKRCATVDEVFEIINRQTSLSHTHLCQALLTLRTVQKMVDAFYSFGKVPSNVNEVDLICSHESFNSFVNSVNDAIMDMNLNELSCCLLYLSKIGAANDHEAMKNIISRFEQLLSGEQEPVAASILARFCIPIKEHMNIWALYTLNNIAPHLINLLDRCDNYSDFRQITICLQKTVPLLNESVVDKYVAKCEELLLKDRHGDEDEVDRLRTVVKTMMFLNFKAWDLKYYDLNKRLALSTSGNLKLMSLQELAVFHKIVYHMMEPYKTLKEIHEVSMNYMTQYSCLGDSVRLITLGIMFPRMQLLKRCEVESSAYKYLKRPITYNELTNGLESLYFLLRGFRNMCSKETKDAYWLRTLKSLQIFSDFRTSNSLIWTYNKYLNYSLEERYNNEIFETTMISWMSRLLKTEVCSPPVFTKMALLVLFHEKRFQYNPTICRKILNFIPRMSLLKTTHISFLLFYAMQQKKTNKYLTTSFLHFYVQLITTLNEHCLKLLKEDKDLKIEKLNTYLQGYNYRRGVKSSEFFIEVANKYDSTPLKDLNSKHVKAGIMNLTTIRHVPENFINVAANYCIGNKNDITAGIIASVLIYCYNFGFVPAHADYFSQTAANIIERDKETLQGLILVKCALSLCYFNQLPASLINYIFRIQFLEKLDNEIHDNNSSYNAVRNELMELNRAVCIDYPDLDIPWFHEKYCREQQAIEPYKLNSFHMDVLNNLEELVDVKDSIKSNHVSPYGHNVACMYLSSNEEKNKSPELSLIKIQDILLYLNREGQPVNPNNCKVTNLKKVAIILETDNSSSEYFMNKGRNELHVRHLEMLNYRVLPIRSSLWNSMYMSEPLAKRSLLRKQIWSD